MKKNYTLLFLFLLASTFTFAQVEGTWVMAPQAAALGVGPSLGDITWWSNTEDDLTTRACYFDDEYIFNADGTFSNVLGDMTWLEPWQSGAEECGAPLAPHDGSNASTWSYDAGAGTLTLSGLGSYLGLPKVHNDGELGSPADAVETITYNVEIDGDIMNVNINFGGIGVWHYVMQKAGSSSTFEHDPTLFTLFPNPASDVIQITSEENIDQVIIRDVTGKSMIVKNNLVKNEAIDVTSLSSGLFLVECRSGKKMSTKKLIML